MTLVVERDEKKKNFDFAGEITLRTEKRYVTIKYQNKTF